MTESIRLRPGSAGWEDGPNEGLPIGYWIETKVARRKRGPYRLMGPFGEIGTFGSAGDALLLAKKLSKSKDKKSSDDDDPGVPRF